MTDEFVHPPAGSPLRLTVGEDRQGRKIACITAGGHPQIPGSGDCYVLSVRLVENLPNQDPDAWFDRMCRERPWETRQ
jgi:hypothetical protein